MPFVGRQTGIHSFVFFSFIPFNTDLTTLTNSKFILINISPALLCLESSMIPPYRNMSIRASSYTGYNHARAKALPDTEVSCVPVDVLICKSINVPWYEER